MSSDAAEPTMTSGFWFTEEVSPVMNISMKLDRITFDQKTKFQRAQIVETAPFGKTLVLDGKTQSALNDEFVYHESLVHPSMLAHPSPKRVFIGGGGELATAREVLKHSSVESCVMVDIDGAVVDICKSEMPEWAAGCTEDPRLTVVIDDAKAWLENTSEKFDVVIMDIADPIEAGPGIALYYTEFYKFVTSRMNPGGIFVTQSGPGSIMNYTECNTVIHNTLKHSFDHVVAYSSDVPSFGSNWGFNMAFNSDAAIAEKAKATATTPLHILLEEPIAEVDAAIAERITSPLRFYDGIARRGIFGLPKAVRVLLASEERVMSEATPVFMY